MEISNISDFEINGEARTNLSYIDEVFPILENELSDYAFFMFSFVKKTELLANPSIQIIYHNSIFTLTLNFEFECKDVIDGSAKAAQLMRFSNTIATESGIEDYYGGLEPASDVQTRFFSKSEIGPLFTRIDR